MSPPAVRFFYDFIDPLSYLVSRELAALSVPAEAVAWHPFELRPPPTPLVTLDDDDVAGRWREAREIAGDDLRFDPPTLVPWTRKAHEMVLHAAEHTLEARMRQRIFDAYHLEGADIGRVDILVGLAVELGLDRTEARAVLDVDRHEGEAATLRADAVSEDVTDTPTILHGEQRLEGFHNRHRLGTLLGT
jgi:predicted DsbA family dithiol-disulfide isomerase